MLNVARIITALKVQLPPVSSRIAFTHTSLYSARREQGEASPGQEVLDYDRMEVRHGPNL